MRYGLPWKIQHMFVSTDWEEGSLLTQVGMKLVQAGNSPVDVSMQGEARANLAAGAGCCGEKNR